MIAMIAKIIITISHTKRPHYIANTMANTRATTATPKEGVMTEEEEEEEEPEREPDPGGSPRKMEKVVFVVESDSGGVVYATATQE